MWQNIPERQGFYLPGYSSCFMDQRLAEVISILSRIPCCGQSVFIAPRYDNQLAVLWKYYPSRRQLGGNIGGGHDQIQLLEYERWCHRRRRRRYNNLIMNGTPNGNELWVMQTMRAAFDIRCSTLCLEQIISMLEVEAGEQRMVDCWATLSRHPSSMSS